jgi:plasmid stabilization system protein ParE
MIFSLGRAPRRRGNAVLCIQAAARQLESFPEIGKLLGDGRRELFAAFGAGAYVLRYRLEEGGQPVVIRVWHTREWRGS